MTTDNAAANSTNNVDAPSESAEEAVDYKTQADELQKQVAKLTNDAKAQSGRRGRQQELENLLLQSNNDMRILSRKVDALVDAVGSGNIDTLPQDLSNIRSQAAQTQADLDYQSTWGELSDDLVEATMDDDGNEVLNLRDAPELEEVRQLWTTGHQNKDVPALQRAVRQAQRVVRQMERQKSSEAQQAARQEGREEAEGAGAFDLSTGPSAGGSGGMSDDQWIREVYSNPDHNPTNEDNRRAKVILDRMRSS